MNVPAPTTAQHLLLTAERLFARYGLDGVSLRQIGSEAGSANNSAVAYHFGSKEGLVAAIFSYRLPHLLQRRELLMARLHPQDLRTRLEAHLLPLFEQAESGDGFYLSFVEQLERGPATRSLLSPPEATRSQAAFVTDLHALLEPIDPRVRSMRIDQVQLLSLHAAAERERTISHGDPTTPFGLFVSTLLDACAGYLTAPLSDETQRLLAAAEDTDPDPQIRLL